MLAHSLVEARRLPSTEENWKKRKKIPKNLTMTGSVATPVSSAYLLPTWNKKKKDCYGLANKHSTIKLHSHSKFSRFSRNSTYLLKQQYKFY